MKTKTIGTSVLFTALMCASLPSMAMDLNFDSATGEISKALKCKNPKITQPSYKGQGRLYGCIEGKEYTAKVFVNERNSTGTVENIKVMWNDWTKGATIHADKTDAQRMLSAVVEKYSPELKTEIMGLFAGNKGKIIETENFAIQYSFTKGPAIDERLVVFTPK